MEFRVILEHKKSVETLKNKGTTETTVEVIFIYF